MNNIKVNSITETTFDEGNVWVEYQTRRGLSYELNYDYKEGDEAKAQDDLIGDYDLRARVSGKPSISVCSDYLGQIIEHCRQSENEMWFVEFEDLPEHIDLEAIEDEADKLGLEGYLTTYDDDCAIVLYGGIITKFIF